MHVYAARPGCGTSRINRCTPTQDMRPNVEQILFKCFVRGFDEELSMRVKLALNSSYVEKQAITRISRDAFSTLCYSPGEKANFRAVVTFEKHKTCSLSLQRY